MKFTAGVCLLFSLFLQLNAQKVEVRSNSGHLTGGPDVYVPGNLIDTDLRTWWTPGELQRSGPGASVTLSFPQDTWVYGFRIHCGSHHPEYPGYGNIFSLNNRIDEAELVLTKGNDTVHIDLKFPDWDKVFYVNTSEYGIRFPETVTLIVNSVRKGSKWNDLCISEFKPVYESYPGTVEYLKPVTYEWNYSEKLVGDSMTLKYQSLYDPASPAPKYRSTNIQLFGAGKLISQFNFGARYFYKDFDKLGTTLQTGAMFSDGPRVLFYDKENRWIIFDVEYRGHDETATTTSVFAIGLDGKLNMLSAISGCMRLESDEKNRLLLFGNRRFDFVKKKWTSIVLVPMKPIENELIDGKLILFSQLRDSLPNVFIADPKTGEQFISFRSDCFVGKVIRCAQWEYDAGAKQVIVYSQKEKRVIFVNLNLPMSKREQSWDGISSVKVK